MVNIQRCKKHLTIQVCGVYALVHSTCKPGIIKYWLQIDIWSLLKMGSEM